MSVSIRPALRRAPLFLALSLAAAPALADTVIADDLIVQSSICVGLQCVLNESFGFDTLRLKQDLVRLGFVDTSSQPGFPTTDWQITINDPDGQGTAEFFAIDNLDSGARILRLNAAAPANSVVVDNAGNLGLGTATPGTEVHVLDSDTPTVRLEQNPGGGQPSTSWDVAGNEANFFVREIPGSRLPFRIRPGTPTSTLMLFASGYVGIGGTAHDPLAALHVKRTDGTALLRVEEANATPAARTLLDLVNNGPATLHFRDTSTLTGWKLSGDTAFNIATDAAGTPQLTLAPNGDLAITGTLSQGSSRLLKTAITAVDAPAMLARVMELPVFEWSYRDRPVQERHVGPMAEDFHAAFGLGGDPARLAPSDVAGVALVAVQELAQQVEQRKGDVAEMRARVDALEARAR